MNDYSDIIYLMGAMIVFSLLSLNASYMFRNSDIVSFQSEIEYSGIALAQDIIDEVKWISDKDKLDPTKSSCICNDYPKTITVQLGSSASDKLDYEVDMQVSDTLITGSNSVNRFVKITVNSSYFLNGQTINTEYLKSFSN